MTEKGILLEDQDDGKSLATRDAYELDDLSNAREIQRIEYGITPCRKLPSPLGSPVREDITGPDSLDLSLMPSEITDNIIDCGDATTLIILTEFATADNSQAMNIIPLVFDASTGTAVANVIGMLPVMYVQVRTYSNAARNADGSDLLGEVLSTALRGAPRIGILVRSGTSITSTANVWAFAL